MSANQRELKLQDENQRLKAENNSLKRQINNLMTENTLELSILEGIEKYVPNVDSKGSTTNIFSTYEDWLSWMKYIAPFGTLIFQNYVFVKYKSIGTRGEIEEKLIHFTENGKIFPKDDTNLAIPVVNRGWNAANTKAFLFREVDSSPPVKEITTDDINQPEFLIKISECSHADHQSNSVTLFTFLVFVRIE